MKARLSQVEFAQQLLDVDAVMPADALENARQRLRPDRIVQRDHLMVFAAFLRRDAHMRAALTHPLVTHPAERPPQVWRRSHRAGASRHKDLVPHIVQPYQARTGHAVVEKTVDCFPDIAVELVGRVALRVDAETERAGRKSAVQLVFGDFEYDLCPRHRSLRSTLLSRRRFEWNRQSPELTPCRPIRRTDFLPTADFLPPGVASRVCKAAKGVGQQIRGARRSISSVRTVCARPGTPAREASVASLVAAGTGDGGRRPCRGRSQAGNAIGPPDPIFSSALAMRWGGIAELFHGPVGGIALGYVLGC